MAFTGWRRLFSLSVAAILLIGCVAQPAAVSPAIDTQPPRVDIRAWPSPAPLGSPVEVWRSVQESASLPVRWIITLDGSPIRSESSSQPNSAQTFILYTLAEGRHHFDVVATDAQGNSASASADLEVVPLTATATPTRRPPLPTLRPTRTPSAPTPRPTDTPSPAPTATVTPITAQVSEGTLTVLTYAYEPALVYQPDFPYPRIERSRIGPSRPVTYRAVILENAALRLTFLPELGGRLYQVTDKASGRGLLYTNPVIKPTRWGPPAMGWWLIVGGMEWAFPAEEHGYAWGVAWQFDAAIQPDGSAQAVARYPDPATGLAAEITVTLPPAGRSFSMAPTLINEGAAASGGQLWINIAIPAGPGMRVDFPAESVRVHSAGAPEDVQGGDVIGWKAGLAKWGRWRQFFGAFAAPVTGDHVTMWGGGSGPGLSRQFPPGAAPGLKFFTWGPEGDFNESGGSAYYEIWGGLAPDYASNITLAPGERRGWSETWTVAER